MRNNTAVDFSSLTETFHGTGKLTRRNATLPLSSFDVTYSLVDPTAPILFSAIVDNSDVDFTKFVVNHRDDTPLVLDGTVGAAIPFRSTGVRCQLTAPRRLEGQLLGFDYSFREGAGAQKVTAIAFLLSSNALCNTRDNGWHHARGAWAGPGAGPDPDIDGMDQRVFSAMLAGRRFSFTEWPVRTSVDVGGAHASLKYSRVALVYQPDDPETVVDVDDALASIEADLMSLLLVLSFAQREVIDWSAITVVSDHAEENSRFPYSRRVRQIAAQRSRSAYDPLIDNSRMDADALERMRSALAKSPYQVALRISIEYLIECWHSNALDYAVLNAFTALECIVNAWSKANQIADTIGKGDFRHLSRAVKSAIDSIAVERNFSAEAVDALKAKVTELQHAPFAPRVAKLLTTCRIPVSDLWFFDYKERNLPLTEKIRVMYQRRSLLVHQGIMSEPQRQRYDAWRAHTICERIVLVLIDGLIDWTDDYAAERVYALSGPGWLMAFRRGRPIDVVERADRVSDPSDAENAG